MSAVPSLESSTTTIWSTTPPSRRGMSAARIAPIVAASSRAGRQTETELVRAAARRAAGNSRWEHVWLTYQEGAAIDMSTGCQDRIRAAVGRCHSRLTSAL